MRHLYRTTALEEILFARQSPEILHLATHGFFLGDQKLPYSGRGWEIAYFPAEKQTYSEPIDRVIDIENPLLRSGILLAGAKNSLIYGNAGLNDGIVTAEKILGMNLHRTKMVVLSACDTGFGESQKQRRCLWFASRFLPRQEQ
jgi:CHAT domain-containing protein